MWRNWHWLRFRTGAQDPCDSDPIDTLRTVVGILSRWRDGKDFDLTRVRVPRRQGDGAVIVEDIAPMSPFLLEFEGKPTVLIRLDGLPEDEVAGLAKAASDDHCILAVGYKLYSTYPILISSLFIYDSSSRPPLTLEGYRDITSADVQDFVVSLGHSGGRGRVRLYEGDPPKLISHGQFALRIPPFIVPTTFPYHTRRRELQILWRMFKVVAIQRARIPQDRLDFKAAAETHMSRTQNMTGRSVFDNSGIVNESDPDYPFK